MASPSWRHTIDTKQQSPSGTHAMKSTALRELLHIGSSTVSDTTSTLKSSLPNKASVLSDIPPGLGNWDNSCYQNSILQALSALRPFSDFLESSQRAPEDGSSISALRTFVSRLKGSADNGKHIWTPAKLKSMSSWQQQDAQEYYSKMMDEVEKETKKEWAAANKEQGIANVKALEELDDRGHEEQKDTRSDSRPTSSGDRFQTLYNPLEGLLAQRVACTRCGFSEGLSLLPFNCLTVPLGRKQQYNIEDCLDEYTHVEEITGVECANCTLQRTESQLSRMIESKGDANPGQMSAILSLPPEVRENVFKRLQNVRDAIEDQDFSETTMTKKCQIAKNARFSSTKTRQAVVARAPQALVIHINRSIFDEMTGDQRKNFAEVQYPELLRLAPWCLGHTPQGADAQEHWPLDPTQSMTGLKSEDADARGPIYQLRAVVTHHGRHENGHYICYRQHAAPEPVVEHKDEKQAAQETTSSKKKWWRLSDEDVSAVTDQEALNQGSAFMLFYERLEIPRPPPAIIATSSAGIPDSREVTSEALPATHEVESEVASHKVSAGRYNEGTRIEEQEKARTRNDVDDGPGVIPPESKSVVLEHKEAEQTPDAEANKIQEAARPSSPLPKVTSPAMMRTSRSGGRRKSSGFMKGPRTVAAS